MGDVLLGQRASCSPRKEHWRSQWHPSIGWVGGGGDRNSCRNVTLDLRVFVGVLADSSGVFLCHLRGVLGAAD